MNSRQIAIKYLAPKLDDPINIFFDIEIFESILFWCKESTREFLKTQPKKIFLIHYVDDVSPIVDEYLIHRREKMYRDAIKKKNSLFYSLCKSEKVINWLISRYINIFVSLTTNSKFKNYLNITKIKIDFDDNIASYNSNIDEILEFEKLKNLPKKQIIKALQEVWNDSKYENLDMEDLDYLCKIFKITTKQVLGKKDDLMKLNLKKEQIKNEYYQVIINFN